MAINKNLRRNIESQLLNYKKFKARAKQIDNELTYIKIKTSKFENERIDTGGQPSDPTQKDALKRIKLQSELNDLLHKIKSIDNALDAMTTRQRELVTLKYFEGYFSKQTMRKMNVEKSEFYRMLDGALTIFCNVCGIET